MQPKKRGFGAGLGIGIALGIACAGVLLWIGIIAMLGSDVRLVSGSGAGAGKGGSTSSVLSREEEKKLAELMERIDQDYLYEADRETLMDGIYHGLYDSLGDPYSTYYSADEYATVMEENEGSYVGSGVSIAEDQDTGYLRVMRVFRGSPAEAAGIKESDQITGADDVDFYQMDINLAVTYMRGVEGTDVTVHWLHGQEPMEATVTRRKIDNETVTWEMREDGVGYILLAEFDTVSTGQIREALADLTAQGMKGLVLDLRSNPGGLVNVATDIAGEFLPRGVITTLRDKNGNEETYKVTDDEHSDIPLVVLINENSASASELLTGALMDYGRAVSVGTVSFGKGIVQEVVGLEDGSGIRLTIADYYTPNDYNIHGIGITPNVQIEDDPDTDADEQYDRAVEELKKLIK